ncbi:MAG: hypothetical protein IT374_25745 [Polyangiaceae bacterium]|nr:hypothetical protein [Polyangiaceae bacterium]
MLARTAALLVSATASLGCATMSDVIAERDEGGGTARVYAAPAQVVYAEARPALLEAGAEEVREYPTHVTAETGVTLLSWGAVGALFIEPTGPFTTRVTVVVRRRVATSVFTPFDEDDVHRRLATRLSRLTPAPVPAPSVRPTARPGQPPAPAAPTPPQSFEPPPGTI